jgi:hypothetical protein
VGIDPPPAVLVVAFASVDRTPFDTVSSLAQFMFTIYAGLHQNCYGRWEGLGFEIYCHCNCTHKKNEGPISSQIMTSELINALVTRSAANRHPDRLSDHFR